mgnify:CR=1 FL=1
MTNFLSNSLKFTKQNGEIKIILNVLEEQKLENPITVTEKNLFYNHTEKPDIDKFQMKWIKLQL